MDNLNYNASHAADPTAKEAITPQKVIYESWLKTKKPIIYETEDSKGFVKQKEVDFAIPDQNYFYDESYDGTCNLCGSNVRGGIPVKKMFSSNYMDWAIHRDCEATHICNACSFCVGMNPKGRVALFRYPLVAEKTLHLCNTKQFRDYLIRPPEPPFVMIFPTSKQKHLFAKARVSFLKDYYFCNLEEITISVDREKIEELIKDIEALRGIGINKKNIETGMLPWNALKKLTMEQIETVKKKLDLIIKNEMFILAIEVAQKMEEEEAKCYLGLKQTTK